MSEPKDLPYRARLYGTYVSTHYSAIGRIDKASLRAPFPHFERHFLRYLPSDRTALMVDLGCGFGSLVHFLQANRYQNAVGLDISREQTELAATLGVDQVICDDMLSYLARQSGQIDVIFAVDVLEHFGKQELMNLLDAVIRALKPGGRFIAQTANADGPFAGRYRYGDLTHELAFTRSSISQVLRSVGFAQIQVMPIEPPIHGAKSLVRWVMWRGVRILLSLYLGIETGVLRGHILSQNLIVVADKPGAV